MTRMQEYSTLTAKQFATRYTRDERKDHQLHWGGLTWAITDANWDSSTECLSLHLNGISKAANSLGTTSLPNSAYIRFYSESLLQVSQIVENEPPWKSGLKVGDFLTDSKGSLYIVFSKDYSHDVGLIRISSTTQKGPVTASRISCETFTEYEKRYGLSVVVNMYSVDAVATGIDYYQRLTSVEAK